MRSRPQTAAPSLAPRGTALGPIGILQREGPNQDPFAAYEPLLRPLEAAFEAVVGTHCETLRYEQASTS